VELRDYLDIVRKSWVLIVTLVVVGVLAAGGASLVMHPTYTSSTSVFVTVESSAASSAADLTAGSTYVQNQVKSFSDVVTTDRVLQPVIDKLGLDTTVSALAENVTATAALDTVIIDIAVTNPSPTQAAAIANAVGSSLIDAVTVLSKSSSGASPVRMSTLTTAKAATSATSPNLRLNLALGLLVGLALGLGIAVLRRVLDTRVHGAAEVEQVTTTTLLGGITYDPDAPAHPLVVQANPHAPRAEAFRQLRSNLQFVELAGEGRTFVVTSSLPAEGKSSTAANLAITLAESGAKVLLVDGDLRRPKIAEYLGIEGAVGLTDHLIGLADLADVVQPWGAGDMYILPAGQVPPNPSELLGSRAMIKLLESLDETYDTVIIDAPPLLPVTDAAVLSKLVSGGALVVIGSGKITKHQLEVAIASIETVGGHLVGAILNLLPAKRGDAYGRYGYYGEIEPVKQARQSRFSRRRSAPASGL
jgi:capsular exopolysaccharide synthesis family protein